MGVEIVAGIIAGAGVSGTAFTVGTTAVAWSTVAAYALVGGALVGSTIALRALEPKQKVDAQQTLKQATPSRLRGYGRGLVAGSYFFFAANGGVLVSGFALCQGPIDGIEEHWFNTQISPDEGSLDGHADMWPWFSQVSYDSQLGDYDQVMNTAIGNQFGSWWTPDHRLRGIANTVVCCFLPDDPSKNFQKFFPSGAPSYLARCRFVRVWDPRDPAQNVADEGSWRWSANPSVCIMDYVTHPDGMRMPRSRMNVASFSAFANLCDEAVAKADGTVETRYVLWGTYTFDERPQDVLSRMLKTCDAELYPTSDGTIGIRGGKWNPPTFTITPDMIIGATIHRGVNKMAAFNQLRVSYTDVASQFQVVEGDPWDDVVAQAAAGETISQDFPVPMSPSYTQALRLAKIAMAKNNPEWILDLTLSIAGLDALGEETVSVNWPDVEIDQDFVVTKYEMVGIETYQISLASLGPDAYSWSPSEERNPAPRPTGNPVGPATPPAVTGLALSIIRTNVSGQATATQIQATVTAPADLTLALHAQISPDGVTWTDMASNGDYSAISGFVNDGSTYFVQAALRTFGGTDGPFDADSIVVQADTVAPDQPISPSAVASSPNILLSWTTPNSANFYATRILRGTTSTFSAATLIDTVFSGANVLAFYTDTPPHGHTYFYWFESINHSGVASSPVGPVSETI